MLEQLQDFSQVLGLDLGARLSILNIAKVKVVEDVLNLSNLVIFQRTELLIVDAIVFVTLVGLCGESPTIQRCL